MPRLNHARASLHSQETDKHKSRYHAEETHAPNDVEQTGAAAVASGTIERKHQ